MAGERILVVDHEEDRLNLIRSHLMHDCYQVLAARNGEEALHQAKREVPDLILIDLMLPGRGGLDVCRKLKAGSDTNNIPIIMLAAKAEDEDIVVGLELGADDYVIKPFSRVRLLLRLRVALRRKRFGDASMCPLLVHGIVIHPNRHEVSVHGHALSFTATEFSILHFLARRPGQVFSRERIISAIKGDDYPVTERSVDVHVVRLRRKLGNAGDCIETVKGVGYRFKE